MKRSLLPQLDRQMNSSTRALFVLHLFVGLTAIPCGILLVINGLGMPKSTLAHSPFDGFIIPGLILSIVVGGSALKAAILVYRRSRFAPLRSKGAAVILLGWISIEALMVRDGRPLQLVIFCISLLT